MSELENNIDPVVQEHRISICIPCNQNTQEPVPHCQACDIPISKLTSENQEVCPLNKW
jgi:hypothetical protein